MGLTAIRRIAKARWLVLLAAGLLAVYVVGRISDYQAENALTHEAVASVTFREDLATLDRGAFEDIIAEEFLLAEGVNSDLVGDTPGTFLPWQLAEVEMVLDQNQIVFTGRGYSQEDADEIARTMQERYLASSSVGTGAAQIQQEIDVITREIATLEQRILDRENGSPLTDEQVLIESRRAGIENQISSLQGSYGSLGVELLNPIAPRTEDDVRSDIDETLAEIVRLQTELQALPPAPDQATTVDEQALIDGLRLAQLEARWQELSTQLQIIEGRATPSPVVVQPVSAMASSSPMNQLLAFAGAVIVTLMALVGLERTRGVVWAASDIEEEATVLAELPPRDLNTFKRPVSEPWYFTVPGGGRKAAVQLLRSQLDGFRNTVVAFQGSGVYADDTLDLTADVALSAAVSGRSVLLIDATFSGRNDRVEFGGEDIPSLHSMLTEGPDDPQAAMTEMKSLLAGQMETYRDLRVVRCGIDELDASDALAGQRFEMLLDVARESFELVFVAGAGFGEPTSYVLAQRVDQVILVGSIGHTLDRDIEAAQRDFRTRRASLLGVVMLRRRRSKVRRWFAPKLRRTVWAVADGLRPVGQKTKGVFTKDSDDGPGMNGFENTLDRFKVTGDSLDSLKDSEYDEYY